MAPINGAFSNTNIFHLMKKYIVFPYKSRHKNREVVSKNSNEKNYTGPKQNSPKNTLQKIKDVPYLSQTFWANNSQFIF